jgi:hypothetical protein
MVAALGGAAAVVHFKKKGRGVQPANSSTEIAPPRKETVDFDEPVKDVTPAAPVFQAGLAAKEIRAGRELYAWKCSECHRMFDPAGYPDSEWDSIFGKMRGKAKLSATQAGEILRFIESIRGN